MEARKVEGRRPGDEPVVTVDEIEVFVLAETPFRETHFKRNVFRLLMTLDLISPSSASAFSEPDDSTRRRTN